MANVIIALIILLIVGVAVVYIVKEKKKGVQCIGCPAAATCLSAKAGMCSGSCQSENPKNEDRKDEK